MKTSKTHPVKLVRALTLLTAVSTLSGCLGAVAIPLATTAGVTAATNTAADNSTAYVSRVHRMNCSQLRAEHRKLQKNALARANPLSNWSGRMTAVRATASNRGCRLSG